MVTVTDAGLEWLGDKSIDSVATRISTIQIGSGSGNESTTASSLVTPEYSADHTNSNVSFVELDATGKYEAIIRVKGGTEIPANTDISEIAVYAGSTTGTLVVIDDFAAVTVEDGHTEEFYVEIDPQR